MIGLCERFSCLPSQLYAEDADLLRMVQLVGAETEEGPDDYDYGGEW